MLEFFARVADLQGKIDPEDHGAAWPDVRALAMGHGPAQLAALASAMTDDGCAEECERFQSVADATRPEAFFARVLLTPVAAVRPERLRAPALAPGRATCPRCGHPPQVGVVVPEGHGTSILHACSLCLQSFRGSRTRCAACGLDDEAKIAFFTSEKPAGGGRAWQAMACEGCRGYIHLVEVDQPDVVPDVDELAGVAMDAWAREQGWWKVQPNVLGL